MRSPPPGGRTVRFSRSRMASTWRRSRRRRGFAGGVRRALPANHHRRLQEPGACQGVVRATGRSEHRAPAGLRLPRPECVPRTAWREPDRRVPAPRTRGLLSSCARGDGLGLSRGDPGLHRQPRLLPSRRELPGRRARPRVSVQGNEESSRHVRAGARAHAPAGPGHRRRALARSREVAVSGDSGRRRPPLECGEGGTCAGAVPVRCARATHPLSTPARLHDRRCPEVRDHGTGPLSVPAPRNRHGVSQGGAPVRFAEVLARLDPGADRRALPALLRALRRCGNPGRSDPHLHVPAGDRARTRAIQPGVEAHRVVARSSRTSAVALLHGEEQGQGAQAVVAGLGEGTVPAAPLQGCARARLGDARMFVSPAWALQPCSCATSTGSSTATGYWSCALGICEQTIMPSSVGCSPFSVCPGMCGSSPKSSSRAVGAAGGIAPCRGCSGCPIWWSSCGCVCCFAFGRDIGGARFARIGRPGNSTRMP